MTQIGRRRLLAGASGIGATLLAGCSAGGGTVRLLISDQPAAVADFEPLGVTLSPGRVFRADESDDITSAGVTPDETDTETTEYNGATGRAVARRRRTQRQRI